MVTIFFSSGGMWGVFFVYFESSVVCVLETFSLLHILLFKGDESMRDCIVLNSQCSKTVSNLIRLSTEREA